MDMLYWFQMIQTQMYVCTLEEFILVDLDALLYKSWSDYIGKYTGFYTNTTMEEKCENCSWMTIDRLELRELQWHEKVSLGWNNVWSIIPLFASLITPVGVNGNLHWLDAHQTAEETIECHSWS